MGLLATKLKDYHVRMHTKYMASVIFVHINKTGGSSIEKALKLPFQHRTALEILDVVGEKRWKDRFSFAFIRNPWDKVASHYHYRVKTNQTGLGSNPLSFKDWVRLTYGEQALPYYDKPKMFMPQVDWVADENDRILVDYIGRFENLQQDFQYCCNQIGVVASLPHLKPSERGDYRRYYDDATAEIVRNWFAKDVAAFGYSFE
jgi:chondroitin 4-sulfotransferase 11